MTLDARRRSLAPSAAATPFDDVGSILQASLEIAVAADEHMRQVNARTGGDRGANKRRSAPALMVLDPRADILLVGEADVMRRMEIRRVEVQDVDRAHPNIPICSPAVNGSGSLVGGTTGASAHFGFSLAGAPVAADRRRPSRSSIRHRTLSMIGPALKTIL